MFFLGHPFSRAYVYVHVTAGSLRYDELKKLGLRAETEARLRQHSDPSHPQRSGLLVVDQLIPGGPAEGKLDVGDVLLMVDGKDCTTFVALEEALDGKVHSTVQFTVERCGRELRDVEVAIEDLHALTPSVFLEAAGAVLHQISFMQARNGNLKVGRSIRSQIVR